MFERFTPEAAEVVREAEKAARELKHNYVGTEHILLALLRVKSKAAQALKLLNLTDGSVHAQIVRIVGRGEESVHGSIPHTPRTRKVWEFALREALALGHPYIGAEHILLGLARTDEGVGIRILYDAIPEDKGYDARERVRNGVIKLLAEESELQREEQAARRREAERAKFRIVFFVDGQERAFVVDADKPITIGAPVGKRPSHTRSTTDGERLVTHVRAMPPRSGS